MLMGCDGLWGVMSHEHAAQFVWDLLLKKTAAQTVKETADAICRELLKEAVTNRRAKVLRAPCPLPSTDLCCVVAKAYYLPALTPRADLWHVVGS